MLATLRPELVYPAPGYTSKKAMEATRPASNAPAPPAAARWFHDDYETELTRHPHIFVLDYPGDLFLFRGPCDATPA